MSSEQDNSDIEKLYREAGPILKQFALEQYVIPERVRLALQKLLDEQFPILTAQEMKAVLLKVLSGKPMDGFELIGCLEKAHLKLIDGSDGSIYGLLAHLETDGYLEGRWIERGERMIKTYHMTENGAAFLEKVTVPASQVSAWSQSVLSVAT